MAKPSLLALGARLYLRHWRRMLFFSACIAAGVAFLGGVDDLLAAVERSIGSRARELMAADLEVGSNRPFDARTRAAFARVESRGARGADIVSFSSMLQPERAGEAPPFLVSVKAVEPSYPFYGTLELDPPAARAALDRGLDECLLEDSAALQHGVKPGDTVRLGRVRLRVAGIIRKEPDRALLSFNLAPRVILALPVVERTGLIQFGSRVRHRRLFALPSAAQAPKLKDELERELNDPYLSVTAFDEAEPNTRETLRRTTLFFTLVSLVGLLVGTLGMAASVAMFLEEQVPTAGLLRCLGLEPWRTARLYHGLCLALGVQGGLLGALAGWALSALGLKVARALLDLPVEAATRLEPSALLEGAALACVLAVGVNWTRVRALAGVSPLEALHERFRPRPRSSRAAAALLALALAALFAYAWAKGSDVRIARNFTATLAGASAVIALANAGALRLAGAASSLGAPMALRHGILRLTRRGGRTLVTLFSLSTGFALLGALGVVHHGLASEILLGKADQVPDLFLVDIQKTQLEGVRALAGPDAQFSPLIRARLAAINGAPIARADLSKLAPAERARQRFLTREYNLTYKRELNDSETVVAGKFWGASPGAEISLEEGFAERTRIRLGDSLRFDIQGREIEAKVTSLRKLEWMSMRPNFFVVLPPSLIGNAPQSFIGSLRVRDPAAVARFQNRLLAAYPNVSVIDVTKALDNIARVLDTLLKALKAMAGFCAAVGLLVLMGMLGLGQKERRKDAALLRALGFTRKDVLLIDAVEFLALGLITFLVSCVASYGLGFALSRQLDIRFSPDPRAFLFSLLAALLLPLAVGFASNAPAYGRGVLEGLRREA